MVCLALAMSDKFKRGQQQNSFLQEASSGYGHYDHYDHNDHYHHNDHYGHMSYGSYSGHEECCPLVIDPMLLTALLGFLTAAAYFLQ